MSLFNLFFTTKIPPQARFSTFSAQHILLLAAAVGYILLLSRRLRAGALKLLSLLLPAVYLIKFTAYIALELFVEPQMPMADRLPLHLCAMNALVMPVAVFTKNRLLLNYIYAVALPAAFLAMLTPAMSYYGAYFFLSWQVLLFYIDHGLMVLVALLCVKTGYFEPDPRQAFKVDLLLASYALVIYFVDRLTGENYMFLNDPDEGTVMAFFAEYMGNPGYLAALVALAAFAVVVMYLPYCVKDKRRKV